MKAHSLRKIKNGYAFVVDGWRFTVVKLAVNDPEPMVIWSLSQPELLARTTLKTLNAAFEKAAEVSRMNSVNNDEFERFVKVGRVVDFTVKPLWGDRGIRGRVVSVDGDTFVLDVGHNKPNLTLSRRVVYQFNR